MSHNNSNNAAKQIWAQICTYVAFGVVVVGAVWYVSNDIRDVVATAVGQSEERMIREIDRVDESVKESEQRLLAIMHREFAAINTRFEKVEEKLDVLAEQNRMLESRVALLENRPR